MRRNGETGARLKATAFAVNAGMFDVHRRYAATAAFTTSAGTTEVPPKT